MMSPKDFILLQKIYELMTKRRKKIYCFYTDYCGFPVPFVLDHLIWLLARTISFDLLHNHICTLLYFFVVWNKIKTHDTNFLAGTPSFRCFSRRKYSIVGFHFNLFLTVLHLGINLRVISRIYQGSMEVRCRRESVRFPHSWASAV